MWMKMDPFNDNRSRKRLSLPDRLRVIQIYDNIPNNKKVAKLFNCSPGQIRNIISNKEKTLALYAKDRRARRIVLLGKVISEWFQRAQCSPYVGSITFHLIERKVLEAKRILELEDFQPNSDWFGSYNIREMNVKLSGDRHGPTSLNIQEIIDYVKDREGFNEEPEIRLECTGWLGQQGETQYNEVTVSSPLNFHHEDQPPLKVQRLEDDYSYDIYRLNQNSATNIELNNSSGPEEPTTTINNFDEALKYLKPLEDFVLLEENYRAIGLISELEKIFSKATSH